MENKNTTKSITFTMVNNVVEIDFNSLNVDPLLFCNLQPVKEKVRRLFEEHAHREKHNSFNLLPPVNKSN